MKNLILRVLVGSRAHGLERKDSDYDYRGVFVTPTEELISLKNVGGKYKASDWFEGKEDQTTYEIGHFLKLAIRCNPSILEVFKGIKQPVEYTEAKEAMFHPLGHELIQLFPYVWNPNDAFNAFTGYGHNQLIKMVGNHLERWEKYAVAYLRTLFNLNTLLESKDFSLEVPEGEFKDILIRIRDKKDFTKGEVVDYAECLIDDAKQLLKLYESGERKQELDIYKLSEFLLKVRKQYT